MTIKQCVACGVDFDARGPAKTCSPEHRAIVRYAAEALREINRKRRRRENRRPTIKQCVICEGEFSALPHAITCSRKCYDEKMRRRAKRHRIEHRERNRELARLRRIADHERIIERGRERNAEIRAALKIVREMQQGIMP